MIDWWGLFHNSLWVVGLAVDLAALSMASYQAHREEATLRRKLREPGFQVPFSRRIKAETDIKTMAVGVIVEAHQAEEILQSGGADLVALGREIMHDPFWPLHAAEILDADADFKMWPKQYAWAVDRRAQIKALNTR